MLVLIVFMAHFITTLEAEKVAILTIKRLSELVLDTRIAGLNHLYSGAEEPANARSEPHC
jgi:hypothetical protein